MEIKHSQLILWIILLLISTSCYRKQDNTPSLLLSERQMSELLSDMHIIEASINYRKTAGVKTTENINEYYEKIFSHHGVNEKVYAENIKYYTQHPDKMESIMQRTLMILTAEQDRVSKEKSKQDK